MSHPIEGIFSKLGGLERDCVIIVSKDDGLWHLSMSYRDHLPSYDDLKKARYEYLPGVRYVAQIFPPENEFVNVHSYALHLWELSGDVSYADDQRKYGD